MEPDHNVSLPTILILLLHLHILSYPYANAPEYTPEKLFSPTRPLRERTKTMEDIIAFLIDKIEGEAKRKEILHGLYPCLRPSDSVSFRINATKYLDNIRTTCIRNTTSTTGPKSYAKERVKSTISSSAKRPPTGKPSSKAEPSTLSAQSSEISDTHLWWSAIVVRKSLLEECCGDKFEKLLLAFSTHALYCQIRSRESASFKDFTGFTDPMGATWKNLIKSPKDTEELLRKLPQRYASLISQEQEKHNNFVRRISDLNLRTRTFGAFRDRFQLLNQSEQEPNIPNLVVLQESAYRDVLKMWTYSVRKEAASDMQDQGSSISPKDSLDWFLSLCSDFAEDVTASNTKGTAVEESSRPAPASSTLPVAAAHHPMILKKFATFPHIVSVDEVPEPREGKETSSGSEDAFENLPMIRKFLNDLSQDNQMLREMLDSAMLEEKKLEAKLKIVREDVQPFTASSGQVKLWIPPESQAKGPEESDGEMSSILAYLRQAGITGKEEDEEAVQKRFEERVSMLRDSLSANKSPTREPQSEKPNSRGIPQILQGNNHSSSNFDTPRQSNLPARVAELTNTVRQVPITPRRSTLLPSMLATFSKNGYVEDLLADTSLPEESMLSIDYGKVGGNENEDDVPFEGHSIALRDMLLNVEEYEDGSFNLMGNELSDNSEGSETELSF